MENKLNKNYKKKKIMYNMVKKSNSHLHTGIPNLDDLLGGGIPLGNQVMIYGNPGVGKTLFCLQSSYFGVKELWDKTIYFTFEETEKHLIRQANNFGWKFNQLDKKDPLFKIISFKGEFDSDLVKQVRDIINDSGAKRVIIDSVTNLIHQSASSEKINKNFEKEVYNTISKLSDCTNATIFLVASDYDKKIIEPLKFNCDGIIKIENSQEAHSNKKITIEKMRATEIDSSPSTMELDPIEGFIIKRKKLSKLMN